ncbi:hypothetical protein PV341_21755 [Streptomyces sp. PA03-1a]|nr:hypothetical protein [Streptomyces sp. PA03-1a]
MWHLISALVARFLPARGRGQAEALQSAQPVPTYRSPRPAEVIDADDLPLVPHYLVAFELRREQQAQRERRTAAVLATMGIDYTPEAVA